MADCQNSWWHSSARTFSLHLNLSRLICISPSPQVSWTPAPSPLFAANSPQNGIPIPGQRFACAFYPVPEHPQSQSLYAAIPIQCCRRILPPVPALLSQPAPNTLPLVCPYTHGRRRTRTGDDAERLWRLWRIRSILWLHWVSRLPGASSRLPGWGRRRLQ